MKDKTTSAEVSASRVVAALDDHIDHRQAARDRLREEKIADYSKPRSFLGIDMTRTPEQAVADADKNLNQMQGENSTYYSHGFHMRAMMEIRDLAVAATRAGPGATMRISVDDFQYIAKYYNNPDN